MNTMYVPFAAFGGSAFGAISTLVSGWVSRRRRRASSRPLIFEA